MLVFYAIDWTFARPVKELVQYLPAFHSRFVWEFHGDPPSDLPGLEIVGQGTAWSGGVTASPWTATIYPGPKGNFVFNAATIFWAQGMSMPPGHMLPWSHWSRPHGPDPRVQQISANLLRRAGCQI